MNAIVEGFEYEFKGNEHFEGKIFRLRPPKRRLLKLLFELSKQLGSDDPDVVGQIYDIVGEILTTNTNRIIITQQEVDDNIDMAELSIFINAYLTYTMGVIQLPT
jgi:hypothetical protein